MRTPVAVPQRSMAEVFYYISQRSIVPIAFMNDKSSTSAWIAIDFDKNRPVRRLAITG